MESLATDDWLLVHCVLLDRWLPGTIAHNPRSNMNNAVGYGRPARRGNDVVLGTDGIGADMLEEFRMAYVAHRADDVLAVPDTAWGWVTNGYRFLPECADDRVTWTYDHVDSPWHVAFTPGTRATDVVSGTGEVLVAGGQPTRVDLAEVRAHAAEQAARLFAPPLTTDEYRGAVPSPKRPSRCVCDAEPMARTPTRSPCTSRTPIRSATASNTSARPRRPASAPSGRRTAG